MRPAASLVPPARSRISFALLLLLGAASISCTPQATASPSVPSPSPTSAITESPPPSPVGSTAVGPCSPTSLAAQVTGWTGAAGSRIGGLELRNTGSESCVVFALARPQLVDAQGAILIDGAPPGASQALELAPGGLLSSDVRTSNYCGPQPVAPVTVALVLPEGLGRVVAAPDATSNLSGVPPCLGPAGSAGTIEMQPWQP